ncbi:hypothetical protein B0H14DRAFT_2585554 [Mycena olivaceomarginata]|nr:hypothetical protein B0H14DRAFT_2585554 [Mycena olivaceomarginata]
MSGGLGTGTDLEYCGNGHLIHIGSAAVAVPCYGAPSLSEYYAIRDLKTRALPPVIRGARRPEMTDSIAKELRIQKAGYDKALSRKRAREGDENRESEVGPVRPKKARLSADRHLVLATKN